MTMQQLLPLILMGQMNNGSGSSENGEQAGNSSTDLLMRMLLGQTDDITPPLWNESTAFGTRMVNGSPDVGTLSLRLMPPTAASPRVSLELVSGGQRIVIRPDEIQSIKAFLNAFPEKKVSGYWPDGTEHTGTISELYEQAHELVPEAKRQGIVNQAMRS